jgi:hypothetical protein
LSAKSGGFAPVRTVRTPTKSGYGAERSVPCPDFSVLPRDKRIITFSQKTIMFSENSSIFILLLL